MPPPPFFKRKPGGGLGLNGVWFGLHGEWDWDRPEVVSSHVRLTAAPRGLFWWNNMTAGSAGGGPCMGAVRQKRLDRRLEEVAKAVGGRYCRLQMP